jgi:hypothetical protein
MGSLLFRLFGVFLISGILLSAGNSYASNEGVLDVDGKSIQFRLPSNYCTVAKDDRKVGEFLWRMASQNVPAEGELIAVAMDCDSYDVVQEGSLDSAVNLNGFRLAAVLILDESSGGTREGFITSVREGFDASAFAGGEASLVGSDANGVYIQIEIEHGAEALVNVGGLTMVKGVVVDIEFITFNQGSLTRNRLLSDAESTIRRLVLDNGTDADLTGHTPGLSFLMLAALTGGVGLIFVIGLIIWLNRSGTESVSGSGDVWGSKSDRPRPVERSGSGSGFGRRARSD